MAEFTLSLNADPITGTGDADHFVGTAVTGFTTGETGGSDALDGGDGDDHFYFGHNTTLTGTVEGGTGTDTVHLYGTVGNITTGLNPTFTGVEILDAASTDSTLVRLWASQVNSFQQITGFIRSENRIALDVAGTASVDFGAKMASVAAGIRIDIYDALNNNTFSYEGTAYSDQFQATNARTTSISIFYGEGGEDVFLADGSGGLDQYFGGEGSDTFDLDGSSNSGLGGAKVSLIDGGQDAGNTDLDVLEATSTDISGMTITGVEVLRGTNITATIAQINQFSLFVGHSDPGGRTFIIPHVLEGVGGGGIADFTNRIDTDTGLFFNASNLTSGGTYTFGDGEQFYTDSPHTDIVDMGAGEDEVSIYLFDDFTAADQWNCGADNDTIVCTTDLTPAGARAKTFQFVLDAGPGIDTMGFSDGNVLLGYVVLVSVENLDLLGLQNFVTSCDIINVFDQIITDGGGTGELTISLFGDGGAVSLDPTVTTITWTTPEPGVVTLDGSQMDSAGQLTGSIEGNTLIGSAYSDILRGNAGATQRIGRDDSIASLASGDDADTLIGGAGNDTLIGGVGNDTYVLGNEASGVDLVQDSSGIDTITSTIDRSLGHAEFTEIEKLVLLGSAISGTGNNLVNTITGNAAGNTLTGAGAAADTLIGLAGNDTYVMDATTDTVQEAAGTAGGTADHVRWTGTNAQHYLLAANVELLTMLGTANTNGTGNAGINTITGNAGANVLSGGAGLDTLKGLAGNDTYVINRVVDGATTDAVSELANGGTDTVNFTGNGAAQGYTLGANIENLTLLGTLTANGTGNTLANTITGNAAANTLNGMAGLDTLRGLAGNDTYVINRAVDGANIDTVSEAANAGTDTVNFTGNGANQLYTLGANLENLTLLGGLATNGTGNTLANVLTGNAAANILNGGLGLDTLTGGLGTDSFVFNTALGAANRDRITDMNNGNDTIRLENAIFVGLGAVNNRALTAAEFNVNNTNGVALEADDRIIYDQNSGQLWYDSNGSLANGTIVNFATVNPNQVLTAADFFVI